MDDSFEVLGVKRNATEDEVRAAYCRKMIEAAPKTGIHSVYPAQLVREAYHNIMKGFDANRHLALVCTKQDLWTGITCRCGSKYSPECLYDGVVECISCSCYLKVVGS